MAKQDSVRRRLFFDSITLRLDALSTNRRVAFAIYSIGLALFFGLVLLPPIIGILLKVGEITSVFADEVMLARSRSAILWSFTIAFLVATIDLAAALPLAWFIVRTRSKVADVLDTLADIPFIIPTVALGFSTLLYWGGSGPLGIVAGMPILQPGLVMVLLLHFTFSYPVVVRIMVGELSSYRQTFEIAAKTLGAEPFTAVRTVTLPILRPSIIAAYLLSFSRSLSETGATVVVAGAFENGPIFIRNALNSGLEGPLALVSSVLILTSVATFALIGVVARRIRLPVSKVWPNFEKRLSGPGMVCLRDVATLLVFLLFVLLPSLLVALPGLQSVLDGTLGVALTGAGPWHTYWQSMILSYSIGVIATVVNMVLGMPVAILIGRKRLGGTVTSAVDMLVNVPIVVPSVALGVSLGFFWRSLGILPEFWVLVFAHMTITYTYFVRTMSAAIESVPLYYEEAARTLGARPLALFRKIVLPLTKYSLFSGAIMTFARSVDETGAATAVSKELKTAPVLLVDWVKGVVPVSESTRGLGVGLLVATSFLALLALRFAVRRK